MDGIAIETRELTKRYGTRGTLALDGLDLNVNTGEVFGFLGPNGAGKTTTIRLLLDQLRATSGTALVLGGDSRADGRALRARIGYLPGELPFAGRQSAGDLLRFLGHLRGGVAQSRIDALAHRFELDLAKPVRALSKGNKQKVALVQAFMHEPELLILDEPSSGLDPLMQAEFQRLVHEVRQDGRTVFMSSHILAEVEEAADRVAILREGRLVAVERMQSLRERAGRPTEIRFASPVALESFGDVPGIRDLVVEGTVLSCVIEGSADALIKRAAQFTVEAVTSRPPDLEDVFMAFYGPQEGEGDGA